MVKEAESLTLLQFTHQSFSLSACQSAYSLDGSAVSLSIHASKGYHLVPIHLPAPILAPIPMMLNSPEQLSGLSWHNKATLARNTERQARQVTGEENIEDKETLDKDQESADDQELAKYSKLQDATELHPYMWIYGQGCFCIHQCCDGCPHLNQNGYLRVW